MTRSSTQVLTLAPSAKHEAGFMLFFLHNKNWRLGSLHSVLMIGAEAWSWVDEAAIDAGMIDAAGFPCSHAPNLRRASTRGDLR
eukprot:CAMPEP_0197415744 /NCGR_PEP_ID=MMETSP1170-20131217/2188_1 /TAXON_ID=54406 /ORGANISM="Sarcinochrysis sp, Strain CCMP770" /LENGTH=83 /DNA_ID=CAMNT_0042942577 /DNA_START=406 /DNA_END=654 /DNA_ORIENTATION=+